jgi:hypothetical protein
MLTSRSVIHALYRAAVAALLVGPGKAFAQRTGVASDFPIYNNGGKPDLTVDPQRFVSPMEGDRPIARPACPSARRHQNMYFAAS